MYLELQFQRSFHSISFNLISSDKNNDECFAKRIVELRIKAGIVRDMWTT